ncbi:MAG: polysaccharide pyruvyl transferase family protein, partial [Dietzia sp.]
LHHGEHPDVLFTDTVWRLAGECPDAAGAIGFTRRAVRDLGVRPAVASGVDLLRSASVVHLIGGGYVNDLWPHHLGVAAAAGEVGRLTGARVVATGQGLVPCGDVGLLADAFSGFDLVAVRDETSLDLLADTEVPVRLVGDDGWLALSEEGGLESVRHPVYSTDPDTCRDLVVCAQADLAEPAEFADAVARVLADWGVPGERMTVIESIPGGDRVVWDMVCERAAAATSAATATSAAATSAATATSATTTPATIPATEGDDDDEVGVALAGLDLPRARFVPFQELWSAGLPARPGQVWLSTRFHPHLFAAARGASGVALRTGSAYYDVKHRSLRAAGSAWTAVAAGDGHVPDVPTAGGFDPAVVSGRVGDAEALAGEIYPLR